MKFLHHKYSFQLPAMGSVCTDPGAKSVLGQFLHAWLKHRWEGKKFDLECNKVILKIKYVIILIYHPSCRNTLLWINVQDYTWATTNDSSAFCRDRTQGCKSKVRNFLTWRFWSYDGKLSKTLRRGYSVKDSPCFSKSFK